MNVLKAYRPMLTLVHLMLLLFLVMGGSAPLAADKAPDVSDVVTKLKAKLNLNDQQVKEVSSALTELATTLETLTNNQEGASEDDDPHDFIKAVKEAQDSYQGKIKKILTPEQMQNYEALREQVIMDALDNLAAIKLMDIQDQIGFSDDQLKKLTPVLGQSMGGLIKIAWKYAGERRIRLGQKIRIARELKEIQHKSEGEVKQILTPDQYNKWEAYKKQEQGGGDRRR